MPTVPTLDEICSEFDELETGAERLEYLLELGQQLPPLAPELRIEPNRVQGCQSNVWVVVEPGSDSRRMGFQAESDAPMVQGLVGILLAAYSGRSAREILDLKITELFQRLQLRSFLSPMRSNGLFSMVQRIQTLAELTLQAGDAATTTAVSAATAAEQPATREPQPPLTLADVQALRDDFPILQTMLQDGRPLVYLDNGASTQRPRQVLDAMRDCYESYYSNVHRGGHALAARTTERYEAAREAARRFVNAQRKHEIIFTSGTTASINLVARSWGDANVGPGDEILLTILEHHSNIVPWQQLAQRTGCRVRFAPITDGGELDMAAFQAMLGERTKLVSVASISNVLGTINPLEEIVRRAHDAGAVVLLDAAQSAPHHPLDVQALDVDFVAFSGHKMLGPSGVGVLYGKESLLEAMPPFLGGGSMIGVVTTDGFTTATLPSKFEAGTPPIVPAIGLGAAIAYLEAIGLERIHRYEQSLSEQAHRLLGEIPGLRILGPSPDKKAGIVTFVVDGLHAADIASVLDSQGVAIRGGHHCAMPLHERLGVPTSSRASFYFYNTPAEVETLAAAVRLATRMIPRR